MLGKITLGTMILLGLEIRKTDTYKRYKNRLDRFIVKNQIKKITEEIFFNKGIYLKSGDNIKMPGMEIEFIEYGFKIKLDISLICSYKEIKDIEEYIKSTFKAYEIRSELKDGYIYLFIYIEKIKFKDYKKIYLNQYQALIGMNYEGNIIVDMRITPHLLVIGLPGSGKSRLLKTLVMNLDADVILMNVYKEDFKGCNKRVVNGNENIIKCLNDVLKSSFKRQKVLYLIIDELVVLAKDKDIEKLIREILVIGRHLGKGVFIIGASQDSTKEVIKYKNYFSARVCMRMIENAAYQAALGCTIEESLKKREFYLYSDDLYKGITFNI